MNIEYTSWYSDRLKREMPVKIYGHGGKPCLVIPSQDGKHNDFEGFRMVDACSSFINEGRLQLFCIDTIDQETVSNTYGDCRWRIVQHENWVQYIIQEVLPYMQLKNGQSKFMVVGCSMGAYHAGNLYFRFPDRFDRLIAMSGVYNASEFMGNYMDDLVYRNSPYHSLQNLPSDHPYMELFRQNQAVLCVGQGAWEDVLLASTRQIEGVLKSKNIPVWVDYWGYDVNHDWTWWRVQFPYFLGKLL